MKIFTGILYARGRGKNKCYTGIHFAVYNGVTAWCGVGGVKTMGAKNVQANPVGVVVYRGIVLKGREIVWRASDTRFTRLFAEQDARQHISTQLFSFEFSAWYQQETVAR